MKNEIIERQAALHILNVYKDSPVIKVLCGIRRAGKSFILKLIRQKLLENGIESNRILYIDFEDFEFSSLKTTESLHSYVKEKSERCDGKRLYLLFDEIQEVPEWEKCINSFYASEKIDCDIYLTGSNAKLLSSELATYISGRYVVIPIFPLSYSEYLNFYKTKDSEESFNSFMKNGGFPGLAFMNQDENTIKSYIDGIYSTVLLKDVISRNKIRDTDLLEKVILYLCENIGNIFSAKKIADFMKSMRRTLSIETIYNDLNALQNALFIYKIQRYDIKGKKVLETLEKYYIADQGIKYNLLGFRDSAINGILENIVCIELLRRGFDVKIGKIDGYEIDFIAEKKGTRQYIQVAYILSTEETKEREMRPLKMIDDNFPKLILTLDNLPNSNENGILRMNLREWLLSE